MPRKRTLRTRIDAFIQWALIALVVFAIILYLIAVLITEQSLIAAAIGLLLVAVPVGIWYRRRAVRRRQAWLHVQQAQQLGQLLTVSGEDFEDIAVDLFQAVGYRDFERIGGSGDLGVDLVGQDPDGRKVIIQCKRYGRGQKIGSPAVQALMGAAVNNGADKGVFVTTSTFTAPAVEHARGARVPIDLIDGDALTRLVVAAPCGHTVATAWS